MASSRAATQGRPPQRTNLESFQRLGEVGLLTRVWPPERVVLGLSVCTWTQRNLLLYVEEVQLTGLGGELVSGETFAMSTIAESMLRFRASRARIIFCCNSTERKREVELAGFLLAVDAGLSDCIARVDLSIPSLRHDQLDAIWAARLSGPLRVCHNLTHLNLRQNRIGPDGAFRLAVALNACKQLIHLDLYGNEIEEQGAKSLFRVVQGCSALSTLDLGLNQIRTSGASCIARAAQTPSALVHLGLAHSMIGAAGMEELAAALKGLPALQTLDLSGNQLWEEGARILAAQCLRQCNELRTLKLEACCLTEEGMQAVCEAMPSLTALKRLSIGDNQSEWLEAVQVVQVLRRCSSLTSLEMGAYCLGTRPRVAAEVAGGLAELQEVVLGKNGFTDHDVESLCEALSGCTRLRVLDLSWNRKLADGGATAVAEAMQGWRWLERLELGGNNVGGEGGTALGQGLGQCRGLVEFGLADNRLGMRGLRGMCAGLGGEWGVQTLTLARCALGGDEGSARRVGVDEGDGEEAGAAVQELLGKCHALRRVDVAGNGFRAGAVRGLAAGLTASCALEEVCVESGEPGDLQELDTFAHVHRNNEVGDEGARWLGAALEGSRSVQRVDLVDAGIGREGALALGGALKECVSLREVDLRGNPIGDEGRQALRRLLGRGSCRAVRLPERDCRDLNSGRGWWG